MSWKRDSNPAPSPPSLTAAAAASGSSNLQGAFWATGIFFNVPLGPSSKNWDLFFLPTSFIWIRVQQWDFVSSKIGFKDVERSSPLLFDWFLMATMSHFDSDLTRNSTNIDWKTFVLLLLRLRLMLCKCGAVSGVCVVAVYVSVAFSVVVVVRYF